MYTYNYTYKKIECLVEIMRLKISVCDMRSRYISHRYAAH